jgi:hypothetical protein
MLCLFSVTHFLPVCCFHTRLITIRSVSYLYTKIHENVKKIVLVDTFELIIIIEGR